MVAILILNLKLNTLKLFLPSVGKNFRPAALPWAKKNSHPDTVTLTLTAPLFS